MKKPSQKELDKSHSDPTNWKWGIFYYNVNDTRIFPPKRNKMLGYTINFANTKSVLVFAGIIFLPIGLVAISAYLRRNSFSIK